MKILIADDEKVSQLALKRALEKKILKQNYAKAERKPLI